MKYWITQTGEKLLITEMTTRHIENCIRMLERQIASKPDPVPYESFDSDGAFFAGMSENRINDELEEKLQTAISVFQRELRRRSGTLIPKDKLKPFNAVIQICPECRKPDVYLDDGHLCSRIMQEERELSHEYYD